MSITLVLFNIFSFCFLLFILQDISEQFIKEFETNRIFKQVKNWTKVTHVLGVLASLDSCQIQILTLVTSWIRVFVHNFGSIQHFFILFFVIYSPGHF